MWLSSKKYLPIIILIILDVLSVLLSVYFSAALIYSGFIPILDLFLYYTILFSSFVLPVNFLFKNYTYLNRSFGIKNLKNIFYASLVILICLICFKYLIELLKINLHFYDYYFFSFRNIFAQIIFFSFFTILIRLLLSKLSNVIYYDNLSKNLEENNFVIYGAGRSGMLLIDYFQRNSLTKPSFIIDDDPLKIGRFIQDIKIISFAEFENIVNDSIVSIKKLIFCIPSLDSIKTDVIKKKISKLNINFEQQSADFNKKNMINIIDKISQNSKNIKGNLDDKIKSYFRDKTILVTGAGGSIGKEICYQVSKFNIKRLIVIDIDEYRLSVLNREILVNNKNLENKYFNFLGDVNNYEFVEDVFDNFTPDIVYHAAASKHVDLVQKNWFHGSMNNILSTLNLCKCSNKFKSKKFIFISTDKAVEPINFLGISKSVGEKITKFYAQNSNIGSYSIVRFGNVVGSSGSLLDIIKNQIDHSDIINVTDKNMTRYFMTISDAVNLVLISTKISQNSDCHVLKMGEPVKILDVVQNIIEQNDIYRSRKLKIKFIGKRPGEKLHEKLFDENNIHKTENVHILNETKVLNLNEQSFKSFFENLDKFKKNENLFKKHLEDFISN